MRTKWLSRRALGLHAALLVVVGACGFLGWWQLTRALGGNDLSWVYTFEWPFFAVYGVYMWWKLLHEQEGEVRRRKPVLAVRPEPEALEAQVASLDFDPYSEEDPELAAYNRYLASLHAEDAKGRLRRPKATS